MEDKNLVEIDYDNIEWVINVEVLHPNEKYSPQIKLEWGWTAGFSQEKLDNMAEDSPKGSDYVITNAESAKQLIVDLQTAIDKIENITTKNVLESNEKLIGLLDEIEKKRKQQKE